MVKYRSMQYAMRNLTCLSDMCIVIDHQIQIRLNNTAEIKLRFIVLKWEIILDAQQFFHIFVLSHYSSIAKATSQGSLSLLHFYVQAIWKKITFNLFT